jgi:hypothetical protein
MYAGSCELAPEVDPKKFLEELEALLWTQDGWKSVETK